jgi:hypothetical protein
MSSPPDETMAESQQPESSRPSPSRSSNGPQQATTNTDLGDCKKPVEKTISCVSCRKRKLKCDRIKPKCGTCSRLRHECEYPERRRTLGSKRRNMKELEARLGIAFRTPDLEAWTHGLRLESAGRDTARGRDEQRIRDLASTRCPYYRVRLEQLSNGYE